MCPYPTSQLPCAATPRPWCKPNHHRAPAARPPCIIPGARVQRARPPAPAGCRRHPMRRSRPPPQRRVLRGIPGRWLGPSSPCPGAGCGTSCAPRKGGCRRACRATGRQGMRAYIGVVQAGRFARVTLAGHSTRGHVGTASGPGTRIGQVCCPASLLHALRDASAGRHVTWCTFCNHIFYSRGARFRFTGRHDAM